MRTDRAHHAQRRRDRVAIRIADFSGTRAAKPAARIRRRSEITRDDRPAIDVDLDDAQRREHAELRAAPAVAGLEDRSPRACRAPRATTFSPRSIAVFHANNRHRCERLRSERRHRHLGNHAAGRNAHRAGRERGVPALRPSRRRRRSESVPASTRLRRRTRPWPNAARVRIVVVAHRCRPRVRARSIVERDAFDPRRRRALTRAKIGLQRLRASRFSAKLPR